MLLSAGRLGDEIANTLHTTPLRVITIKLIEMGLKI